MNEMIINIRGCSGAGKTTLVRALMDKHGPATPIEQANPRARRYEGYRLPSGARIVGDNERVCGGAEGMKDAEIERVVREYAQHGPTMFEGLFITENVSRWLNLALDVDDFVFAFLRPPVEVCVERVLARRAANGTTRPFKPDRVKATWRRLPAHFEKFSAAGVRCVWLPWEDPLPALEGFLSLQLDEEAA